MKTGVALVALAVELGLSLALIGGILISLAFSSEGHKSGILPLHQALNTLALLIAVVPLGVVLWVGFRHLSGRPEGIPLGLALPLVVGVVCGGGSLLSMFAGERFSQVGAAAEARRVKAQVRKRAEAGTQEMFCSVMVTDPDATAEDMRQCRAYLESRPKGSDRWYSFSRFVEGRTDLKTWNPQEVGLSPFWDKQVALAGVHHDQAWFLSSFFGSMIASGPELFYTDVSLLQNALLRLDPASGWSREALEQLRPQVLPALLKHITREPGVYLSDDEKKLAECRTLITQLITSGPREVPPVPPLPSPPTPETVGVVRMGEDGSLEFWMRATATLGTIGDVYFRHAPGSESHQQWTNTLGPMVKGQVRLVPRPKAP